MRHNICNIFKANEDTAVRLNVLLVPFHFKETFISIIGTFVVIIAEWFLCALCFPKIYEKASKDSSGFRF